MVSKIYFYNLILAIFLTTTAVKKIEGTGDESDLYVIRSALSPVLPVVIAPINASVVGSVIQLEELTGEENQLWRFEVGNQPGLFLIRSLPSDFYLIGPDDGTSEIHLRDTRFTVPSDVWIINSDGHIVNSYLNKHLAVAGVEESGEIIGHMIRFQDEDRQSNAQKFYLIKMN